MPTDQRAETRPISFFLHNTADDTRLAVPLTIRPEDLTRTDSSRLTVHQTLGGAWADNFGPGVPIVNLAGTTGWGQNGRPDGFEAFKALHATVFTAWHNMRAKAIMSGTDPDVVKLIFADVLDDFTWVVAPQTFVLKRNKSRPLLSQYQISLVKIADQLNSPASSGGLADDIMQSLGLDSLDDTINRIKEFGASIAGQIGALLGPVTGALSRFVAFTGKVLGAVRSVVSAAKGAMMTIAGPVLDVARLAVSAGKNVMGIIATTSSIPAQAKALFMRTASAFTNAFCLLSNVFKARKLYPDYSSIYGASNCSSTTGAGLASVYSGSAANPWSEIFNRPKQPIAATQAGLSALSTLSRADIVQSPPSLSTAGGLMDSASSGVVVA